VRRWLPHSLLMHVLLLAGMIWLGSYVDPPRRPPQRVLRVRIREQPQEQPRPEPEQPQVVEPEPEPEPQPRQPEREKPAKLPEAEPRQQRVREKPEPEPEPEPERPRPETTDEPVEEPVEQPAPVPERSQVTGTDQPFPYQYYFSLIEGGIARQWKPKQLGFRDRSSRVCTVHFFIEKDGTITRETVVVSSGIPLFDREALQAVKAARKFPPLPGGFAARSIGVTFVFTLRSGLK